MEWKRQQKGQKQDPMWNKIILKKHESVFYLNHPTHTGWLFGWWVGVYIANLDCIKRQFSAIE